MSSIFYVYSKMMGATHRTGKSENVPPAESGSSSNRENLQSMSRADPSAREQQVYEQHTRFLICFYCSTIMINVGCFLVIFTLPLAMIIIGAFKFNECPAEPLIPIHLIVAGAIYMFRMIIQYASHLFASKLASLLVITLKLVDFFIFVWLIIGSFWIYHIFKPNYLDSKDPKYCNKLLYILAFVEITVMYILFFVIAVLIPFFRK